MSLLEKYALIRSHIVRSLYQNLLGPRYGNRELIEEPFRQYEVGILNSSMPVTEEMDDAHPGLDPEINPEPADVDAEAMSVPKQGVGAQDLDGYRQEPDTDLSFKTGAVSLGLHFALEGAAPKFRICLTWARYVQDEEFGSKPRMFRRLPNFFVTGWMDANSQDMSIELEDGADGSVVTRPGVYLHVITRRLEGQGGWIVKIFLENRTSFVDEQRERDRIFQPQIRVVADNGSQLLDLDRERAGEWEAEDLLYRNRRSKARGYMCAAVWREVDPEKEPDGEIGSLSWPDSESVPEAVREEFTRPLARTEYMPLYAVPQPDQSKRPAFGAPRLSNAWDPEEIERSLAPIESGFSDWIDLRKSELDALEVDRRSKSHGRDNLKNCDRTRRRIRDGIDFLKRSEKARAAFCFMNAVMNDKRRNEKNEDLSWMEFQMAFILLSLRGVSGESDGERILADVLWFPTGGGKTEAYLGILIFAIAYRRLTPGGTRNNDGGVTVLSRYTLRLLTIQQFQRALGAIVASDIRRVENWLPEGALKGAHKITDQYMLELHSRGSLWGNQRFSIGLWIGNEATPKDFAYTTVEKGKVLLHCEGALLSSESPVRARASSCSQGEPAQIQACPVCRKTLCIPQNPNPGESRPMAWIVRSPKSAEELNAIPKEALGNLRVTVKEGPEFDQIGDAPNNEHYYRLTLEAAPKMRSQSLDRDAVDKWWEDAVRPNLDPDPHRNPLQSTSPSMPGYFFLKEDGAARPHDFAIFCTNRECSLNKTKWFETIEDSHNAMVPAAFETGGGHSRSVPISAYTVDEQIYLKCPSLLIATADKFANLPFEPKCASIFGNVDVVHPIYGYGRRVSFEAPIRQGSANRRIEMGREELRDVAGFNPPSLILQDELHLIEGPLGSMVGAYEMAVDVLSDCGLKPKYIASSATIKEAGSQVGTIFRRDIETFPPPGIDSSNSYFSQTDEDVSCTRECAGRLYLGIATTKSTVTLPIKAQSIAMSEIFKIRSRPDKYALTPKETEVLEGATDPYWTFVSYFTDLLLMSKFTNYYSENIIENVDKWSVDKSYGSGARTRNSHMVAGLRLFAARAERDMSVSSVSVYCAKGAGQIRLAVYRDGSPVGRLERTLEIRPCITGENESPMPGPEPLRVKGGERVWIAMINDSGDAEFQMVASEEDSWESLGSEAGALDGFPETCNGMAPRVGSVPMISLTAQRRRLNPDGNVTLSSETTSEDLVRNLERLQNQFEIDSLQTSPVFGTGIDIDRLGVMQVMNQPKTSSGYIQSTGRVGRKAPGLVITWLRAGRVRDLNHYENFVGYHRAMHRFVEPVTASPFSDKAMGLCLGPVMVAILRNARSVLNARVSSAWVDPQRGARTMSGSHDAPDVRALGEALERITSSESIADFRRMPAGQFRRIFERAKASWRRLASAMSSSNAPAFQYAERNPNREPSSNVVLGRPNHKDMGLEYAYENVPISMRQTESTAAFYLESDPVLIRPSQFTTKYGPGSLVSGKSTAWVVPSIKYLAACLNGRGNFDAPNRQGRRGLHKYEIDDSRMKRILHRLRPKTPREKLRLFSLPSNSSLTMGDRERLYGCIDLSRWAVCYNSAHPSKVLAETQLTGRRMIVKCPECQRASGTAESTKFYGVRYVLACKRGHLGDVDWHREVHHTRHQKEGRCPGNVFEWRVPGGSDNVEIACMGHWNGDTFVQSKCGRTVTHIDLKGRSNSGQMACSARFAEEGDDRRGCEWIDGKSLAKMVSKSQMSLRMPIVATTMEIGKYRGTLAEYYRELASGIDVYMDEVERFSKGDFVRFLERRKEKNRKGYTSTLIRQTEEAPERAVLDAIEEALRAFNDEGRGQSQLTELEALYDELSNLERQTRDSGTGTQVGPDSPPPDRRFPIPFQAIGLHFEAMPFEDIRVTQIQTGYTREIPTPAPQNHSNEESEALRIGSPVWSSASYTDGDRNTWFVANQLVGEGIFIHLDPDRHDDGADVLGNGSEQAKIWWAVHKEVRERNELACRALKVEENKEQEIDARQMETVMTNPVFGWWHSFAHELINQLAIDSGFTGVSLGERVYCKARDDKSHGAGVLIYATSPGADGTLGGLTSLVDMAVLPKIVEKTLRKTRGCSNDPLCSSKRRNRRRAIGAACHACLMNSETSCSYQNRFLDRNLIAEAQDG